MTKPDFGTFGVWRSRAVLTPDLAARIERLGYTALWIGGSPGTDLADAAAVLEATERIVVATGIVNIWRGQAADAAASFHRAGNRVAWLGRQVWRQHPRSAGRAARSHLRLGQSHAANGRFLRIY